MTSKLPLTAKDINEAQERLAKHLPRTPLTHSDSFSQRFERDVFVKWDNKFRTGNFKERGALNFLQQLNSTEKKKGVCTASAGNHALAVSWHCMHLNIPCSIVMPKYAPLVKVQTSASFGANVSLVGEVFDESYEYAQELSKKENLLFVPGYDHPNIISGAGVSGLEILYKLKDVDSIVVPIGGGGLAAGIALAVKEKHPDIYILGVRSAWTKAHGEDAKGSEKQGAFAPAPIADGIAVKAIGEIPKLILDQYLDDLVYVEEKTIASAIVSYLYEERTVIEGAGAASLAALIEGHLPKRYKRTVLLACGSNIDLNILSRLIQRSQFQKGQLLRVRVSVPDRPGSLAQLTSCISDKSANVLETYHERRFSKHPGNVEITFLLETKNDAHKNEILESLSELDLKPTEL